MALCWTCGSNVDGVSFTCFSCQSLVEFRNIQRTLESRGEKISDQFDYLVQLQEEGFKTFGDTISSSLQQFATAIEWGFAELCWHFEQQTSILRSIDHHLETPAQTQANEWRIIAENLRKRGVLEESEKFFLMALSSYPLDYRTYVGIAFTYLQMNKFDDARVYLEKSLSHAPKRQIDYKSYSLRLIAHIHVCQEDYKAASQVLKYALELSPSYYDARYDLAQVSSLLRDTVGCLIALDAAIQAKRRYFYLARTERNFTPVRRDVDKLLNEFKDRVIQRIEPIITEAETVLRDAEIANSQVQNAKNKAWVEYRGNSSEEFETAKRTLDLVIQKMATEDYASILDAEPLVGEAVELANKALGKALKDVEYYKNLRTKKVVLMWNRTPRLIYYPLLLGGIGYLGGCATGLILEFSFTAAAKGGMIFGVIVGFIFAILSIWATMFEENVR